MDKYGKMNRIVKEEEVEEYGYRIVEAQPMEGLHETGPPPFLTKTYEMVDDSITNHIVSWNTQGSSFVVWDLHSFSSNLLPRYFKHSNFSSFVRQLNTYGFRKIDPERWEFANEAFIRDHRQPLKNIKRRRAPSLAFSQQQPVDPCVEVGRFGLDGELDSLRRDKHVLMIELVKLRQQQQNTRAYIQTMEQRLLGTEIKQRQMMQFLSRAVQNPSFLQQLAQQKDKRNELEEAMTKKRRRPIERSRTSGAGLIISGSSSSSTSYSIKAEPLEYDEYGYEVSELEALALEMQGYGRSRREQEESHEDIEPLESETYLMMDFGKSC